MLTEVLSLILWMPSIMLMLGSLSLGCAVIHGKMCCMCGDEWSTDLNRYYTIVSRWDLKS